MLNYFFLATYTPCYDSGSFHVNIVNQEHKNKIINTNGTQSFNVVRLTMSTSIDERKLFHYTIKNIMEDITRYNYWVLETSHVSPFFISLPYYESSCSTGYLPFFLTSLFTSYSFYRPISIS